jgi:hypothetical protein
MKKCETEVACNRWSSLTSLISLTLLNCIEIRAPQKPYDIKGGDICGTARLPTQWAKWPTFCNAGPLNRIAVAWFKRFITASFEASRGRSPETQAQNQNRPKINSFPRNPQPSRGKPKPNSQPANGSSRNRFMVSGWQASTPAPGPSQIHRPQSIHAAGWPRSLTVAHSAAKGSFLPLAPYRGSCRRQASFAGTNPLPPIPKGRSANLPASQAFNGGAKSAKIANINDINKLQRIPASPWRKVGACCNLYVHIQRVAT